jgi:hypothetical protein
VRASSIRSCGSTTRVSPRSLPVRSWRCLSARSC